jgi:L-serine dehydratase
MSTGNVSTFELFKIGIGPSSSHTMGPMSAACCFVSMLKERGQLEQTRSITVDLFGSLALTGKGHATDRAVIVGLAGYPPAQVEPDQVFAIEQRAREQHTIDIAGAHSIEFVPERDIQWRYRESLAAHPNGLAFTARDSRGRPLFAETYFSLGGGFIATEAELAEPQTHSHASVALPFPYTSAAELLEHAQRNQLSIAEVAFRIECARRSVEEVNACLDRILDAMNGCIDRGLRTPGVLPGGLNVRRRAADLKAKLEARARSGAPDPLGALDWINVWALAVNEENAAGGRVVTAPTNGAAGVIPAVLRFYEVFASGTRAGAHAFLLTGAAIGSLYKQNASISAAEVGCQGEIGVACSMAAAGLAAAQGASNAQIENAAEIGMEHNLGLTCDPIKGLVQIPCIERNATGAVKAVDAARLAMMGDGTHRVSLDQVIETMRRTGADMRSSYKETSQGGLAVNVPEC